MVRRSCQVCGVPTPLMSFALGVCLACIRGRSEEAVPIAMEGHRSAREAFRLPAEPPREGLIRCGLCARDCYIPEGERGFCGLRRVVDGRLQHLAGTPARGLLHWYRDPLPTNCVADPVCTGHSQRGCHNLAVFYASCTLDCLFCQNWHFRTVDPSAERRGSVVRMSAHELAGCANERTYCACFFGGDPASQMPHALTAGRYLAEQGIAVCWESAGTMHPRFLRRAMSISLSSGGCFKFDLKAYDANLHRALTGASNARTLDNFALAVSLSLDRPDPPPVIASTLLVPGYLDSEEVGRIASFIAGLDPDIPYMLLGFHPHFRMTDLPRTSRDHALQAREAARNAGLRRVRIGNIHLLSFASDG